MSLLRQLGIGVRAGLLAGGFVAAVFFAGDFARLGPLATPMALGSGMLGTVATSFESPVLVSGIAIVSFGGHLAAITLVHFVTFAALGGFGVLAFRALNLPFTAWTGALYGVVVFSLVFYGAAWLTQASGVVELPGERAVLMANLLAGMVMGAYVRFASRAVASNV